MQRNHQKSTESAAASVDTRGYCTTTFVEQLYWSSQTGVVDVVHTEHNSDGTKAPNMTSLRVVTAMKPDPMTINHAEYVRSPEAELWSRADFIGAGTINLSVKHSPVKKRTLRLCPV